MKQSKINLIDRTFLPIWISIFQICPFKQLPFRIIAFQSFYYLRELVGWLFFVCFMLFFVFVLFDLNVVYLFGLSINLILPIKISTIIIFMIILKHYIVWVCFMFDDLLFKKTKQNKAKKNFFGISTKIYLWYRTANFGHCVNSCSYLDLCSTILTAM